MELTLRSRPTLHRRPPESADGLVRLPARAMLASVLPAGTCIAVQTGRIWLTQTGDANDYFVGAGQRHVLVRRGRVVIEGDAPLATLRVLADPPPATPGTPGDTPPIGTACPGFP